MSASNRFNCNLCRRSFKVNFTLHRYVRLCHADVSLPTVRHGCEPKNDRLYNS